MTEDTTVIDAATRASSLLTQSAYSGDTSDFTMAQHRAALDAMCDLFNHGRTPVLHVTDQPIAAMSCQSYHTGRVPSVHSHDGGFYVGRLHSPDATCVDLAKCTNLAFPAVDDRLSPEPTHPAACQDVTRAVTAKGPCLLAENSGGDNPAENSGGRNPAEDSAGRNPAKDSAGRNPATGGCHGLRALGVVPLGQASLYLNLGGNVDQGSYLIHAHATLPTRADVVTAVTIRQTAADHRTARPLSDHNVANLPPTIAIADQCDPLADVCTASAAASLAAGRRTPALTEPGLVHGDLPRAAASFTRICAALTDLAQGIRPQRSIA